MHTDRDDQNPSNDPEEEEEQGAPDPRAIEVRWPLDIVKNERTIFELHRQWQNGFLQLSPDYQREFVWKPSQQMKLVESVMARIPLPAFYLSEETEDEMLVVDGQQRLTTLFAFMEGWFPDPDHPEVIRRRGGKVGKPFHLRELVLMPELNEQTFQSLDPKLQRRFENTPLTCFIIQKGTADNVKYELFERLNQGVTPLSFQEIRNALGRGKGLGLVHELAAEDGPFRTVAGPHRSYDRGRADELVLRGLSFLWRGYEGATYKGALQVFLNESLKLLNKALPTDIQDLRRRFLQALEVVRATFGDQSFQRFDARREQWAGHVSGPLVEVQMAILGRTFADRLPTPGQAARLKQRFQELCRREDFQDSILRSTQSRKNLEFRMQRFKEVVDHVAQPES